MPGTYRLVSGYNYPPIQRNTAHDGRVTVTSWLAPMNEDRSPNVTILDSRLDRSFAMSDRMTLEVDTNSWTEVLMRVWMAGKR